MDDLKQIPWLSPFRGILFVRAWHAVRPYNQGARLTAFERLDADLSKAWVAVKELNLNLGRKTLCYKQVIPYSHSLIVGIRNK